MNDQRSGGEEPASPKGASASMTLAAAALESHNTPERAPDAGAETVVGAGAGTTGVDGGSDVLASGSQASTSTSAVGRGVGGGASACGKQQQQQPQLNATDVRELREIKQLLWGENVRDDVFKRWSQGFEFSEFESTALVQKQGGPCAVIAPVQAYLLKIIIMDMPSGIKLSEISSDKCQSLLIQALCNILKNCRTPRYRIVHLMRRRGFASADPATKERSPSATSESAAAVAARAAAAAALETGVVPGQGEGGGADIDLATEATPASRELSPDEFHNRLHTLHFDDYESLARYYTDNYDQLAHTYGVLLFMYSVFLTKGSEQVAAEVSDTSEPLIHSTYGYGAQSLINLMLTGRAVAHVWDNEQDVGGLKLRGICEQSDIGFITLMEQMRYCTVGSFFKNPRFPVWVMGSDTHLTVLFSNEKRLVSPETPSETGRRIFKSYDPEGNNFISSTMLREVLAALNLVSEPAYVSLMQKRLDPENLGIILLNAFMDEFFPLERRSTPDTFELLHYNGIPGSNENNKVRYYCGSAILLEGDLKSICTSNPMVTCLQTKWPNIEINWHDTHMPSLN
ncbi:ubiquitin carboxyl-terminal hydrolase MINDY-3 homolog isoform X2 [Drosophila bipectinata]|uniref:ubiquitin carboxyl-terminal hydrolase MINDY-3 homolog isoform X2 n=1 Tax=Drosophila bipectinata TaxID=42026 RepID=UPI001C89290C|nr:ubiquitin carboxyl-terminal hydrolase MINDY-3 homolog isoform X2 [Drosophila bipectinata]